MTYVFTQISSKLTPIFYLQQSLPTATAPLEFVILKTKVGKRHDNMFLEVGQNLEKREKNW